MISTPQELFAQIDDLSTSTWTLAAISTLFESGLAEALREPRTLDELAGRVEALPRERIARILDVVALRGLVSVDGDRYQLAPGAVCFTQPPMRAAFSGEMRNALMQPIAYVDAATRTSPTRGWYHTDPKLLQAQGDSSAGFVGGFMHFITTLGDLADRFAKPSARFLDVGVGVGSLSIAMCRAFPQVRAVGLDVFDVPLGIARDKVARAGLADRIELRQVAIEDLKEEEAFDLVWLPACFLAPSMIPAAMRRARSALRPGGWLLMPALSPDTDDRHRTVWGMVLEAWGANTGVVAMTQALVEAGFQEPRRLQGPTWITPLAAQR